MPYSLDATTVRTWCELALEELGEAREAIDAINVYPVADGDTGTNLYLTVESAAQAVEAVFAAHGAVADAEGPRLPDAVRAMAHGALIGARGNSGTILAQLLRGMAEVLAGSARPGGDPAPSPTQRRRDPGRDVAPPAPGSGMDAGGSGVRPVSGPGVGTDTEPESGGAPDERGVARNSGTDAGIDVRADHGTHTHTHTGAAPGTSRDTVSAPEPPAVGRPGGPEGPADAGGDAPGTAGAGDAQALRRALRRAAESAYRAVAHPVEGTVLTVATAAADAAERAQGSAAVVTRAAYEGAYAALEATTGQLDVLTRAGVVDAGGCGLVAVLRALAGAVSGEMPMGLLGSGSAKAYRTLPTALRTSGAAPRARAGGPGGPEAIGAAASEAAAARAAGFGATTSRAAAPESGSAESGSAVSGRGAAAVASTARLTAPGRTALAPAHPAHSALSGAAVEERSTTPPADAATVGTTAGERGHGSPGPSGFPGDESHRATATPAGCPPGARGPAALSGRLGEGLRTGPAYEVIYLLEADDDAVATLRTRLDALGDSLVVVGGDGLWNVHVHVDDAGAAVEAGLHAGRPYRIRITHFASAAPDRAQDRAPAALAGEARAEYDAAGRERTQRVIIAVVPGEGLAGLCRDAGANVVTARPGEPPASGELVQAIRRAHAREIVLLPNDASLRHTAAAAAEQARAEGMRVALIPTRSSVQGIAALAVHEPGRRFDEDVVAMTSAAGATRYAELAVAERQSWTMAGVCQAGDVLGLVDGDVAVIGPDLTGTAMTVLDRMLAAGGEMVTLVLGSGIPDDLADRLEAHVREHHLAVDTVVYRGGQPSVPLLIGVE
ncbi:DAK2 domain-containing protein [Streptomyces sp. 8N706]|uniref:DAK2 domain-containing protein n=1 Tax=Streptomyces sp. 8N706 TaxID=3457416 RepID=UPI003FD307F1